MPGLRHEEDHDHGLAFDLKSIGHRTVARRQALMWFGGAGVATLLAGCGGGDSDASSATTASTTTGNTTTTGSTTTTGASTTGSSGTTTTTSCIADPAETAGPYPADGTNTASGATSNILMQSGIVRSDIRSSFISSTTTAKGVVVTLTLTLVNSSNACAPLSGYAIYLWHADANGNYSLYSEPTESYLRGVQVTDANGQVTFTTIFPACYDGRYPHMHFEVYASTSAATSGRNALLTSQLAMPAAICNAVYTDTSTYPNSATRFASVSTSSDNVFGDNSAAQISQQTPGFSVSVSEGYAATATIGVAI